jgi:UDP-N-acetylglucosamine 1-carboxyvinyltransferase
LANFLVKMGAKIRGQKTHVIEIEGVKRLHGADHTVIPDRIEAGTFMMAAAITGGDIMIKRVRGEDLGAVVDRLSAAGIRIEELDGGVMRVRGPKTLKAVDVTTLPYPGFPTDLQAQMMAMMTIADGLSVITEKIYPERFMHIAELNRMGASIMLEGASAIIKGTTRLSGAPVMASDLRASAALVLAGLVAQQRTDITRIYHLDRGYEAIEQKFIKLGARIRREQE